MADPNTNTNTNTNPSSTSPPRRHWNGSPGDRHEHHNVWLTGGVKAPATSAPWKLDNPTTGERRDSDTSTSSSSSDNSGRKSSTPGLFANLSTQKRNSPDATFATRRQSWNEQALKGGFFSKLWNGYTRGP